MAKKLLEKENAKQEPKVYFCKHITAGICRYNEGDVLITDDTLKKMNATFSGKPVYVEHQKVNLENIQEEADGYVIKSFYMPEDASYWAQFIVVSDKGHKAIKDGYRVSNAYVPESFGAGGDYHNIPYKQEITDGHYTHLALVDNRFNPLKSASGVIIVRAQPMSLNTARFQSAKKRVWGDYKKR
ncbi:MAG: DUF2213 domain-containing protein [Endomicrobium sp.]|nr:DUF2213 domain-containing protein [Endomicrobium sp.]